MGSLGATNFGHLKAHDEQLVRLGLLAERYFAEDPNTCLLKLRQLTELLAQLVASNVGLFTTPDERQADLLRRLQDQGMFRERWAASSMKYGAPVTTPTTAWQATTEPRYWHCA